MTESILPRRLRPHWRGDPHWATADPNQLLVVAERADAVVGTAQLTFVPGLSRRGALRAQIEAVRFAAASVAAASARG